MNHERLAEILNPLKERLEGFKRPWKKLIIMRLANGFR